MNIVIDSRPLNPSKGISDKMLDWQFHWRNTNEFLGDSEIVFALLEEPIWWNRPYDSEQLIKQEADGYYSYNLPFIWKNIQGKNFKTGYNLLLNVNSLPIATQIKVDNLTEALASKLREMTQNIVYNTLLELGVNKDALQITGNDLLYNGKKFFACENDIRGNVFSENVIINLMYKPEEKIFERLTGEHALKRGITGIIEETELFTKSELITKLTENYTKFINAYLN